MKLNFTDRPIAIIGDLILDCYMFGLAERLSPEAPVPVVNINEYSMAYSLGGAGNVAAGIKALGGNPILISATGKAESPESSRIDSLLLDLEIDTTRILHDPARKTSVKTRLIANNQQIARIDNEEISPITEDSEVSISFFLRHIPDLAAIIISDYAKGVITESLISRIATASQKNNIPVFLDPKVMHKDIYRGHFITAMTPNTREAEDLIGRTSSDIDIIGRRILANYSHQYVLITRGEHGVALFDANWVNGERAKDYSITYLPAVAKHVFDVAGAGDTVIAALTLAYASGYPMLESARIANLAAGVVVGKPGTAICTRKELEEIYET